eukprot:SAG31_NODE_4628_length_3085_cov_372.429002_4_plen_89_part_00
MGSQVFGLVTAIVTMVTASSDSSLTLWLVLFSLIVMGACASAAVGVFQNFDWSIRIVRLEKLRSLFARFFVFIGFILALLLLPLSSLL